MKAQAKIDKALGFGKTPQPPKFPMKFREFLRRAFGGRLHADRLHLYRKLVSEDSAAYVYFNGGYASQSEKDAAAEKRTVDFIAKLNSDGITDEKWYFRVLPAIAEWRVQNRIRQRKEANASRWRKEKLKKPL